MSSLMESIKNMNLSCIFSICAQRQSDQTLKDWAKKKTQQDVWVEEEESLWYQTIEGWFFFFFFEI